mgnify:CR=1 FL=1
MEWILHSNETNIALENDIAKSIIEAIGGIDQAFYNSKRREKTTMVMERLTQLGDNKGHKVYSHSLSEGFRQKSGDIFVNREWLYDLVWYEDDQNKFYTIKKTLLTAESEWAYKRPKDKIDNKYGAIKYDFQKLLLSNAELKLMIFRVSGKTKQDIKQKLIDLYNYFNNAIDKYEQMESGEFLFIAFCDKEKSFYYWYRSKLSSPTL